MDFYLRDVCNKKFNEEVRLMPKWSCNVDYFIDIAVPTSRFGQGKWRPLYYLPHSRTVTPNQHLSWVVISNDIAVACRYLQKEYMVPLDLEYSNIWVNPLARGRIGAHGMGSRFPSERLRRLQLCHFAVTTEPKKKSKTTKAHEFCRQALFYGMAGNNELAVEYYERAAELNHPVAQYNLGLRYETGAGVPACRKIAAIYHETAARQGHKSAEKRLEAIKMQDQANQKRIRRGNICMKLARDVIEGNGVRQNQRRGLVLVKEAALLGNTEALCTLAALYLANQERAKDAKIGLHLLEQACELGSTEGFNTLGALYEDGTSVQQDRKKASRCLKMAAILGSRTAQFNLSLVYERARPTNDKLSVKYLLLSAKQGYAAAQCNLGVRYLEGSGVPKNAEKGIELLKASVRQKHPEAFSLLGDCYARGCGVTRDDKKAMELLEIAAMMDRPDAKYVVGVSYLTGIGAPINREKGIQYLRDAAQQGFQKAIDTLQTIHEVGFARV